MTPRATPIRPAAAGAAPAGGDSSAELVSLYAKQPKIYPRAVSGLFARWRWALVWLTQLAF